MRGCKENHIKYAERRKELTKWALNRNGRRSQEIRTQEEKRGINNLKTGFKPHTNVCKVWNGNVIAELECIKTRWKECFEELLNPVTTGYKS